MHSVLETALAGLRGALELTTTDTGTRIDRAPAEGRAALRATALDYVSGTPSGVRFEFTTDAPTIDLHVELTRALYPGTTSTGSTFELVVDGHARDPIVVSRERIVYFDLDTGAVTIERGAASVVSFGLGAAGVERRVEIWLPIVSVVTVVDVQVDSGARLEPSTRANPVWLHHGSSISQASDAGRALQSWPVLVARRANYSLTNLSLAGQCHLDQFMARAIRDTPADRITLELGINIVNLASMRERAFVPAVEGFLDTIREGHPHTPLAILSPLACPTHELTPGPTSWGPDGRIFAQERAAHDSRGELTLVAIRDLLRESVARRRATGDSHLRLIDGLDILGPDDADLLYDGLHPSVAAQPLIAERFARAAFGM